MSCQKQSEFLCVCVSARAEENLKLVTFYCRHQGRVSRQLNMASITLASIRKFIKQRVLERVKFTGVRESPTVNVLRTGRGLWKQSKSICNNSGVRLVCPLITSYVVQYSQPLDPRNIIFILDEVVPAL